MKDLDKSINRLANYANLVVALPGTLAAADYLGDTGNNDGIPMPQGTLDGVRVNLQSADDGNTTVQLENEDTGTTHSFTLGAATYTEETDIGLYFSEGDRLSVTVTGVTTPGGDGQATIRHDISTAPVN